jgi:hypothetical protein
LRSFNGSGTQLAVWRAQACFHRQRQTGPVQKAFKLLKGRQGASKISGAGSHPVE